MAKITITIEDVEGGLISLESKFDGDTEGSPAMLVATAIIESIEETSAPLRSWLATKTKPPNWGLFCACVLV